MRKFLLGLVVVLSCGVSASALAQTAGISLENFAQEKNLQYAYDPLLKNAVVSGGAGSVKFHVGSEFILSSGQVAKLSDEVRFESGEVVAPVSARPYLEGLVFKAATPTISAYTGTHRIRRVVVDAGHGGKDFGAISPRGTVEKHLVLDMARRVYDELRAAGLEVIMTRNSDTFIPLQGRTRIANRKGADLFVSIHANASLARSLQGFEVYYLSEAIDDAALALERAENSVLDLETAQYEYQNRGLKAVMWDLKETENRRESLKIADKIADEVQGTVRISNRRIKSARFYVLKWTECPAVLVEMGYITNREDEARLKDFRYRENLARAIAKGILNYKEEFDGTDGFTR